MISLDSVLVVEDSRPVQEVLRAVLAPHAKHVVAAGSVAEALEVLADTPTFTLLMATVGLPDGSGFDVLAHVRRGAPEARAILMTTRWDAADAERAKGMGALAYLRKPISFRDISSVLRRDEARILPRPARRRSLATAMVRDPRREDAPHLAFEVRDLSASGAFLETKGPVPVGTELDLDLELGTFTAAVKAVVVRIQEPAWTGPGGVGVRFVELDDAARAAIVRHVAEAEGDTF